MSNLLDLDAFLRAYQGGQRHFNDLELEDGPRFQGLDIRGTTFEGCWLCADFSHTDLSDCKFIDCNIKTCDFSHADLTRVEIRGCSVESTEFGGARITGFLFEDNWAYGNVFHLDDLKRMFELNG
jgi:uncharacterized protein YjbI with pentapeptide repeats